MGVGPSFLQQASAAATAQRDLIEAARPYAEGAHKHYLSSRSPGVPAATGTGAAPTLFGRRGLQALGALGAASDVLPLLLGSSEPSVPSARRSVRFESDPLQAARDARAAFRARQQQIESRGAISRVP